jgi:hypothetical protein
MRLSGSYDQLSHCPLPNVVAAPGAVMVSEAAACARA